MMTANAFVQKALSYEGSSDGNYFIRLYNDYTGRGIPPDSHWCAIFVSVVARLCGVSTSEIPSFEGCITGERLFRSLGRWRQKDGYTPKTGDVVIFDWDPANNNGNDHTGIVVSVSGGRVYTIEGNAGNQGVCMRRDYPLLSGTIVGYGTPVFQKEEEDLTKAETQALIQETVRPMQQKLEAAEKKLQTAQAEIAALKKTYTTIDDVPEWYRAAVEYYMANGILKGKGAAGDKVLLSLNESECRMLTMLYRSEAADL